ncbi:MAG: universal stress protein, partial [Azospira sp.]|nr:universal stress protein [Azospira sp.]
AAEQIAAFAAGIGARLLVVGHRGENTLNEFVLGCTALKLVYNAEVPVLLVRTPATADYARVLVAIDRSDCSQRLAEAVPALFPTAGCTLFSAYAVPFESRLRLSGASDAEIDALRLAERERVETEMADFAARLDEAGAGHYEYRLARGFAATEILEETVEMRADLVAVGRHGGGRSEERLLGSVTQNVLYNARCDMLLMP